MIKMEDREMGVMLQYSTEQFIHQLARIGTFHSAARTVLVVSLRVKEFNNNEHPSSLSHALYVGYCTGIYRSKDLIGIWTERVRQEQSQSASIASKILL